MKIFFLTVVISTLVLGCKKGEKKPFNEIKKVSLDTIPLETPRLRLLDLKKEVDEKLKTASSFETIQKYIDTINLTNYKELRSVVEAFNSDIESLQYSFPSTLKTNQVLSRIYQMHNYSQLLESYLLQERIDSIRSEKIILKTLESYNSLVIQLNETENGISSDFKKELEKSKFERDSLKQNEVAPLF